MGCASSKRIEAAVDVYYPAPASFAVFDVNAIEEPWVMVDEAPQERNEKTLHVVPAPILEKLNTLDSDAPHSWDEVSKALEDLKPKSAETVQHPPVVKTVPTKQIQAPAKSMSFHTLEELDAKLSAKPHELRKTESMTRAFKKANDQSDKPQSTAGAGQTRTETGSFRPVKENIFIVRDRLEREREGKASKFDSMISKRDPLSEFPEKFPPGGSDLLVLYTTSLRGVRRTYEDCNRVRAILEGHRVVFDERDVALHGEFLTELKELVGEGLSVPRVFVKGRYIGGAEEVAELNESGRLGRMLNWVGVERGVGRQACEGCGGLRFVPCLECGGSCKVMNGDKKERCGKCNENGLMLCPNCL